MRTLRIAVDAKRPHGISMRVETEVVVSDDRSVAAETTLAMGAIWEALGAVDEFNDRLAEES